MRQLQRNGVALAYKEAGSGAPPIVLVHDLASDHTCFGPQFEHFSCRHRVVAVDLRGHGQSDKPSQACTVALLADDLAWLCYELGLYRPVLLGHGLGGWAALDLAARYRDLPSAIVTVTSAAARSHVEPSSIRETASCSGNMTSAVGEAAADLGWVVPVLRVAFDHGKAPPPEEINVLVDKFLSELAGRAPP